MNLRTIDLNLLPVLEAIYVERSLTRASASLRITQPAVSNALTRLRNHFEDPLFVREGRGVKPTPMADALMPAVRDALDRLRAGLEPRSVFDPAKSARVLNISARDASSFILAPTLAGRLETLAPGIRISWSQISRTAIAAELASGRLDLAIDVNNIRGADLESVSLFSTKYVCVLSPDHSLAQQALTAEEFSRMRHVVVSSRREGRSLIEDIARKHGYRITPAVRLPYYQPALEIVRKTDLVLALPLPLAETSGLLVRPIPFDVPPLESVLYWRREKADDPALAWLRDRIKEIASDI